MDDEGKEDHGDAEERVTKETEEREMETDLWGDNKCGY